MAFYAMRMMLITTLLLAPYSSYAVGYASPSFDCNFADERAERIICSFEDLCILDLKLADKLKTSPSLLATKSGQAQWVREVRNNCTSADCLRSAYKARLAALDEPPPAAKQEAGQAPAYQASGSHDKPPPAASPELKAIAATQQAPKNSDQPQELPINPGSTETAVKPPSARPGNTPPLLWVTVAILIILVMKWLVPRLKKRGRSVSKVKTQDIPRTCNNAPRPSQVSKKEAEKPRKEITDARQTGPKVQVYVNNRPAFWINGTVVNQNSKTVKVLVGKRYQIWNADAKREKDYRAN